MNQMTCKSNSIIKTFKRHIQITEPICSTFLLHLILRNNAITEGFTKEEHMIDMSYL